MGMRNKFALRKSAYNGKYLRVFDTADEALDYLTNLYHEYKSKKLSMVSIANRELLKGVYVNPPLLSKYWSKMGLKKDKGRHRQSEDNALVHINIRRKDLHLLRRFPKGYIGKILSMFIRAISGGDTSDFLFLFITKKQAVLFYEKNNIVEAVLPRLLQKETVMMCQALANSAQLYGLSYVEQYAKASGFTYIGGANDDTK